jgi:hypothetical protein
LGIRTSENFKKPQERSTQMSKKSCHRKPPWSRKIPRFARVKNYSLLPLHPIESTLSLSPSGRGPWSLDIIFSSVRIDCRIFRDFQEIACDRFRAFSRSALVNGYQRTMTITSYSWWTSSTARQLEVISYAYSRITGVFNV